jgi:hypothetical protein
MTASTVEIWLYISNTWSVPIWLLVQVGTAACDRRTVPVWSDKLHQVSTVHDQCQYGWWYGWEQQPATIERYLCDQTNCIKLQSQYSTWSVPIWLVVQVGTAACDHRMAPVQSDRLHQVTVIYSTWSVPVWLLIRVGTAACDHQMAPVWSDRLNHNTVTESQSWLLHELLS